MDEWISVWTSGFQKLLVHLTSWSKSLTKPLSRSAQQQARLMKRKISLSSFNISSNGKMLYSGGISKIHFEPPQVISHCSLFWNWNIPPLNIDGIFQTWFRVLLRLFILHNIWLKSGSLQIRLPMHFRLFLKRFALLRSETLARFLRTILILSM